MGDFCWESSEALSTKLLVVVSLDRNIISESLKMQNNLQKLLLHPLPQHIREKTIDNIFI
jgi:hypothetical protein